MPTTSTLNGPISTRHSFPGRGTTSKRAFPDSSTQSAFSSWFTAQPIFQNTVVRFSGIFCTGSSANCEEAGTTYDALLKQTGGVFGDLGQFATGQVDRQFQIVFESLSKAVARDAKPVDCEWRVPTPPAGKVLDPRR